MGSSSNLPPLPEGMPCWHPRRVSDGATVPVVTVRDAAKLAGVTKVTLERWIDRGEVAICYTPESEVRVFLDALMGAISKRRG